MKKIILLAIVIYLSDIAVAQVQFGVKAGANFSILHTSSPIPEISYKYLPGFTAGAFMSFPLSGNFFIQPEVVYAGQGTKVKTNFEENTTRLQYINVPVVLRYQIIQRFFAEIGPQAGLLLNARRKVHSADFVPEAANDPLIDKPGDNKDVKQYFNSFDLSGVAGLAYFFTANTGVQLRYNLSLISIAKNNDATLRNSVFQLNFVYLFSKRLKK